MGEERERAAVTNDHGDSDMAIEIQYAMKCNGGTSAVAQECSYPDCGGVLYYPDVDASVIGGPMETFRTIARCTECDDYSKRTNTAPRYLCWRVVVRA